MNKKLLIWVCAALVVVLAAGAIGWTVYDRQDVFRGSRVRNPDSYLLEFSSMNQTDFHEMDLHAGDRLRVEYSVTHGHADLQIGIEGQKAVYKGNGLSSGDFIVEIPEDGIYRITFSASHAAGSLSITLQ